MNCPFQSRWVHTDYGYAMKKESCETTNCAVYDINNSRCGMIGRNDQDYQTLLEKIIHLQNKKLKEETGG